MVSARILSLNVLLQKCPRSINLKKVRCSVLIVVLGVLFGLFGYQLVLYIDNKRSLSSLFSFSIKITQVPLQTATVLGLVPLFLMVLRLELLRNVV